MSTYNIYGNNHLVIPNFDFLMKLQSGHTMILSDKYMKWVALFCVLCGFKFFISQTKKIPRIVSKLKLYFKKPIANECNYVVIFGFGDSEASITLTKHFSKLGYNLILLNNEITLDHRTKHELNKIDNIHNVKSKIFEFTYEQFSSQFKAKVQNEAIKIDFIFDCSIFRIFTDETSISNHKYNNEDIYYNHDIMLNLKMFSNNVECISDYFSKNTKIFLIDYVEKRDDINHKLLWDYKFTFLVSFLKIYLDRYHSLRSVSIKNKHNRISDKNVDKIYRYSDLKDEEFSF
jgi:hypothetical protein